MYRQCFDTYHEDWLSHDDIHLVRTLRDGHFRNVQVPAHRDDFLRDEYEPDVKKKNKIIMLKYKKQFANK